MNPLIKLERVYEINCRGYLMKMIRGLRKKPLTKSTSEFRVFSVNLKTQEVLLCATCTSLEEAKRQAQQYKTKGVDTFVQGEHNRVLYRV